MSYQIITDSCCDFTKEQQQQRGLGCVNLTVLYNGETHTNFSDPNAVKAFYDELRSGTMATTSGANPNDWESAMTPALEAGRDVLVMTFTSALSTTYQTAEIAASELREKYPQRKIFLVDTLCAAPGQGLLVHHACKKRDTGMPIEDLAAWLEGHKRDLCHWVTVDDLSHLKRGGRISSTTALVGTMLNVKPIIHVDDEGRLINCAKVRGRKAALEYLVKKFTDTCVDFETVFIGHGDCPEDAAALEAMLREKHEIKEITTSYIGPVIGAHTGPGVLALFFLGTKR